MSLGDMIAKKVRVIEPTEKTKQSVAAQKLREAQKARIYNAKNDAELKRFENKLKRA